MFIFFDLNWHLNRITDFSRIFLGSIFTCGRAESGACRGSTGVCKDTEPFKIEKRMRLLNKGLDLFLFVLK